MIRNRKAMEAHAVGASERYKQSFPLEPSCFFSAMGHVLSRAFSSHSSLALMPLVDLCNHRVRARPWVHRILGGDVGVEG